MYISFSNYNDQQPNPDLKIHINNINLERVQQTKYLGLLIDQNLKWNFHLDWVVKRTRYLIYIFARLSRVMSYRALIMIYHGLFLGLVTYGSIAWGSAGSCVLKSLCNVQKKILKTLAKKSNKENDDKLATIESNYIKVCILFHYNTLKTRYENSCSKTRNKSIALPTCKLEVGKKNHYVTAVKYFNDLPNGLKNICTKPRLKKKIKEWTKNLKNF